MRLYRGRVHHDYARRFDGKKHIATVKHIKEIGRRFDEEKYIFNEDNCATDEVDGGINLLQAINSYMGHRIDTASNQLASMNHQMSYIEFAVTSLDGRVSATEKEPERCQAQD